MCYKPPGNSPPTFKHKYIYSIKEKVMPEKVSLCKTYTNSPKLCGFFYCALFGLFCLGTVWCLALCQHCSAESEGWINLPASRQTVFISLNVWLASPGNIIVTAEQNAIYHIFIHSKTFGDHLHRVKRLLQRSNWHFPRQRKADPSVWDGNVSKKGKKKEKVEGIKKLFYWNNLRGVIMSEGLRGN